MSVYQPTGIKKLYHDTKRYLAKSWLSLYHPTQIAITGSQGKTGTTDIVTRLVEKLGPTLRTDVNLDTTFNVPLTALKATPATQYVVWELGIDHPGEMAAHLEIAEPTIGIITGISPVHTDAEHMGSLQTLIEEKRKLIECLPKEGHAILNYDDELVRSMMPHTKASVHWYGSQSKEAEVQVLPESIRLTLDGTTATCRDNLTEQEFTIQTGLIGHHHIKNLMAGYLVLKSIGVDNPINLFTEVATELRPLRGRMNIEPGPLDTILLNDSLRANPESTKAGLQALEKMEYVDGRKIAVIGEMGELENPEIEHRETGNFLSTLHFDFVLCIGPLRKYTIETAIQKGFPKEKIVYAADVFEAAELLRNYLKPHDLWYLKGSLLRNYKRIVQILNNEEVCCHETLCPYNHCGYYQ